MTRSTTVRGGVRVAVVHEWISSRAGSEKVFEALAALLPGADLVALSRHPEVELDLNGRTIRTTLLDRTFIRERRALTLPLMPLVWRALGKGSYDLVLTSHHAFASGNRLASSGLHVCYVHTPARYVWTPELDGRGTARVLAPCRGFLKKIDRRAAARLDSVAANSSTVAERIERFWGRRARVIYPPVDTEFFRPGEHERRAGVPDGYVLGLGRWISYKNLDIVIRVAEKIGRPAVIAGRGPEAARLRHLAEQARVPVALIESPSQEVVRELYRGAHSLIFPTVEDFGIVPVEAQACGTPVVAPALGGVLDTVKDGVSGALAQANTVDSLADAIGRVDGLDPRAIRLNAERFSYQRFAEEIERWLADALDSKEER